MTRRSLEEDEIKSFTPVAQLASERLRLEFSWRQSANERERARLIDITRVPAMYKLLRLVGCK